MLILLETKKNNANMSWLIKNLKSNPINLFVLFFSSHNKTTIMVILLKTKKNNINRSWFIKNLKNNPISMFIISPFIRIALHDSPPSSHPPHEPRD
jgi:uncharacterized protein YlaI